MSSLAQTLAEATFPIYGVRPANWVGAPFLGTAVRLGERLERVQLLYLDDATEPPTGLGVSNLDPTAGTEVDPLEAHLGTFASRFDDRFVPRGLRRKSFKLFPPEDFGRRTLTTAVAGMQVGAELFTHREVPLTLLRTALRAPGGVVDLGVAGWASNVVRFAQFVEPVDLAFAKAFDLAGASPVYPPPGWEGS